jgi:molecular chaperone DnaK (HSP70)
MLLQQARRDAEAYANQPVTEVVLTVPSFFGQAARRSVITAANLAGLKPLQLINDYLAGKYIYALISILLFYICG